MSIRTERLLLRDWQEGDREPWAAMNADPRVREFFPSVLTREESDASFDRMSAGLTERGWGLWAVEADGAFLGFTGLAVPGFRDGVEIGWRFATEAWGHGYATEAARAVLDYGFTELGLPEILSFTAVQNLRSRAVMERIGMARDEAGDFEHPNVPVGSPVRAHVLYRIAASPQS
jgi:RimJ/RimL family protein N-acetyltransferase